MQNPIIDTVTVSIMDREFKIKCPENKATELQKAANYLDSKMREIYHGNRLITIDRVAITAALNIAHELMQAKQKTQVDLGDLNQRLLNLRNKLKSLTASA